MKRYYEIQQEGKSLKEISEVLQDEFGRGYWSIEKILKKTVSKRKNR